MVFEIFTTGKKKSKGSNFLMFVVLGPTVLWVLWDSQAKVSFFALFFMYVWGLVDLLIEKIHSKK